MVKNKAKLKKPYVAKNQAKLEKPYSIYPLLHEDVSRLLAEEGLHYTFHDVDDPDSCVREYHTAVMGRFVCQNRDCNTYGWSSKKIYISIREYKGDKYNARVYRQHCESCNAIGRMQLDGSYAERVAYRIKFWNGIVMERPPFFGTSKGPHQYKLCEGCLHGGCMMASRNGANGTTVSDDDEVGQMTTVFQRLLTT